MTEFIEFPHRLFLERRLVPGVDVEPSHPAPRSSTEPSEKVKAGLAEILPKIDALKPSSGKEV